MKSEFKRAMKLMWGHSWRVRMSCGCSILFLCVCLFLLFWGESSFFEFRRHRHVFDGQGSFSIGTRGSMLFFFFSLYGNGRLLLYGFGKWLRSSKVAKSMLVDCLIVNRLLVFGVMFLPCLVSRICLIGMGYGEYARIALFWLCGELPMYYPRYVIFRNGRIRSALSSTWRLWGKGFGALPRDFGFQP